MGAGHYQTHGNGMTGRNYVNEARSYALLAQAAAQKAQKTLEEIKKQCR